MGVLVGQEGKERDQAYAICVSTYDKYSFETYDDYPEAAKNAAFRAVEWAEKNGWGDCGTDVGTRFTTANLPAGTIPESKWNFYTYVYNGTHGFFYRNGTLLSSKAQTAPSTFTGFYLGYDGANTLNASVDEIRIYNRSLDATEINNLYILSSYHNYTQNDSQTIYYNATFDFNETVLFAKDYRVKSLIYTGSPFSESIIQKNLTAKEIEDLISVRDYDDNFAPIDYSKSNIKEGSMGFSWLLKAYLEIKEKVLLNIQELIDIRAENQRIKTCLTDSKDFDTYKGCVLK
jgi:hypothetical protein